MNQCLHCLPAVVSLKKNQCLHSSNNSIRLGSTLGWAVQPLRVKAIDLIISAASIFLQAIKISIIPDLNQRRVELGLRGSILAYFAQV
jgi:hypothetical protein